MDIRSAVRAVLPFCAKEGPYSHVLFSPAIFFPSRPIFLIDGQYPLPHVPARVGASNGLVCCAVDLDPQEDVSVFVAPAAKDLAAALSTHKGWFRLDHVSNEVTAFVTPNGSTYLPSISPDSLTIVMESAPTFRIPERQAALIAAAMHACASPKDIDLSGLDAVHLRGTFLETTDQSRIARAVVDVGVSDRLVSPLIFHGFQKRVEHGIRMGRGHDSIVVHYGEQVRYAPTFPADKFPRLDSVIHDAPSAKPWRLVSCRDLDLAVRQCTKASKANILELNFGAQQLEVWGMGPDGSILSRASIPCSPGVHERVALRAKKVAQTLQACTRAGAMDLWVYCAGPGVPIRFAFDGYLEVVYPLAPERTEAVP